MASFNAAEAHSVFLRLTVEFVGVGAMTVVAGFNDALADIMLSLMVGFALIWLYSNMSELQSIVGKIGSAAA